MPDTEQIRRFGDAVRGAGKRFTLVAPIAWPRTEHALLSMLTQVATDGPITISVNDLGIALALAAASIPDCELTVGLGLTRQFPHSSAPQERQGTPVLDIALLQILYQKGISAVEVDADTPTETLDSRWHLRHLIGAVPLAYGRSCPTARYHHSGPPQCRTLCDTPMSITPRTRWSLSHGHRQALRTTTPTPALTIWGNAVYRPESTLPEGDDFIIDARWHPPGALSSFVDNLFDATVSVVSSPR